MAKKGNGMKEKKLISQILENAKTINQLHNNIKETFERKNQNPAAWSAACERFHTEYDRLAFPRGLLEGLRLLQQQDPATIALAITYLKADPYFFRSGYNKQEILRRLKRAPFTKKQTAELQEIIIAALKSPRTFSSQFAGLARNVQDAKFKTTIEAIIKESDDKREVRRARTVLHALNS
jgi:hypothetical protein